MERAFGTENIHRRNARDRLDFFHDDVFGVVRQFHDIPGAALNRHEEDRIATGVGFGHHGWRVDVLRQVALRLAHFVAYVIGSLFQFYAQVELDSDVAYPQRRRTGHCSNACNTVDGFFERFGDLAFHDVGTGAGVTGSHRDIRRVDRRVFTNAKKIVSDYTEQYNQDAHDRSHDRASQGKIR